MKKSEQYLQIILQTKKWYDRKIKELKILGDHENNAKIIFNNDNEHIELPEHLKEGFYLGIKTAIEVVGKFPINITNNEKREN